MARLVTPAALRAIAICLLLLIAFPIALRAIWNDYDLRNRGVAWGPSSAATYPVADEAFGLNVALEDEDPDVLDRSLDVIRSGGYGWVRQRFPWKEIEPVKGIFHWEKWDRLVGAYADAGLKVVAILDQPPHWSRKDNNWTNRPPDALADYADFIQVFAGRYAGLVDVVQVWDEPNIFPNWGNRAVDPAGYVELLKAAYPAAKTGNPDIRVMSAGLAPNGEEGGRNMADTRFLEAMYRHSAGNYFDVLAAKPYGFGSPPEDRRTDDALLNFSRLVRLREIMVAHGDQQKPVWAVEFGWNSLPDGWQGEPSVWGQVTEEVQADYTARAIGRARDEWPWLEGMVLQGFYPQHFPDNPLFGFSVVDSSLRPRPAYISTAAAIGYPFARVGRHSIDSRHVQRNGQWSSADYSAERVIVGRVGDSLKVSFQGTRLDLLVQRAPNGAAIEVIVDGARRFLSPQLDSAGRFDLFAPSRHMTRLIVVSGLPDGPHTAELRVAEREGSASGKAEAAVAGFVVVRDAPFSPHFALLAALTVLAFGLLLAASSALLRLYRNGYMMPSAAIGRFWRSSALGKAIELRRRLETLNQASMLILMVFCLAAFYFLPSLPLAVVFLLAFAGLAWTRIDVGLLCIVMAVPFYTRPKQIAGLQFSMVEILILTCAVVFLFRHALVALLGLWRADPRSSNGKRVFSIVRFVSEPVGSFASPITLFLAASLLSLLAAERLHEALRELRTVVVEPLIFYWLLVKVFKPRNTVWLADALIASAVVLSLVGLYQYYFIGDVITAEGVLRMKAFYGSPNNLGLFLGRILPLAFCVGAFGGEGRRRLFYLGSLPLLLFVLALTFSAGAWLGTVAALLVVLAFQNARLCAAAAVGAGSLIVMLPVMLPQLLKLERITSRFDLQEGTAALRLMIWQAAVKMIGDHPLLGVGLDNFLYQYPRYMLADAWREPHLSHPHNLVLDYWLRAGLLGLAAALWLIARAGLGAVRVYRRSGDVLSRAVGLGVLGSMTDFIVHGMIDNAYFTVDLAVIFWMSLAAVKLLEGETKRL